MSNNKFVKECYLALLSNSALIPMGMTVENKKIQEYLFKLAEKAATAYEENLRKR